MASAAVAIAFAPGEPIVEVHAERNSGIALGDDRRREMMARRLADLLFLPAGQVSPHEKSLLDEILSRLYGGLDAGCRLRLARRIARLAEPPRRLLRLMAADEPAIAGPFLERPELFEDADLASLVRMTGPAHHALIVHRHQLGPQACDALIATGDEALIETLIVNPGAGFTPAAFRALAELARVNKAFEAKLLARADLSSTLAQEMFWWADAAGRQAILHRFSMERRLLGEAVCDLVLKEAAPADLDWAMRLTGALRVPARVEGSEMALLARWLEGVEEAGAVEALAQVLFIAPATIRRIGADKGGEPAVVLLKALGLTTSQFKTFAPLLAQRLATCDQGRRESLLALFGTLSTDWADLVLRVWDQQERPGEAG
jgi:hypothetical protein